MLSLLGAVLLLTVALPFAGGLAGGRPDTRNLTLVSLFAVHVLLAIFLVCYFLLSSRRPFAEFLRLRSERPVADFSSGILIGFAGWLVTGGTRPPLPPTSIESVARVIRSPTERKSRPCHSTDW